MNQNESNSVELESEATLWIKDNCDKFYQPLIEYFKGHNLAVLKETCREPEKTIKLFDPRHRIMAKMFVDQYSTLLRPDPTPISLWFDNNCDDFYRPIREYFEYLSLADLKAACRTPHETIALFDRRHKMIAEIFFKEYASVLCSPNLNNNCETSEPTDKLEITKDGYLSLSKTLFTPEQLFTLITNLSTKDKDKIIAIYLNDRDMSAEDYINYIFPACLQLKNLSHINLARNKVKYNEMFLDYIIKFIDNGINIIITDNPTLLNNFWITDLINMNHLIWLNPTDFMTGEWRLIFHDQPEIIKIISRAHYRYPEYY